MKLLNNALAFSFNDEPLPSGFEPLSCVPLIIVVGLTGVGKSTVINLLNEQLNFTLLPNRREITDEIIIPSLQQQDGETPYTVTDRLKRFDYTARYRAQNPGGMAHALSLLAYKPATPDTLLIFDGLRGLEEVQHGTIYLPHSRFVVLDAPDMVRLTRLLQRGDAFDNATLKTSLAGHNMIAALLSIPNIDAIFDEAELRQISRVARANQRSIDDVVKKAAIIVEERRNYDSNTARVHLSSTLPPHRVMVVDTAAHTAEEIAVQVGEWVTG